MPKVFLERGSKISFLFCSCISFADLFPIYYVPESADIIGASVLVVEIVGMFPYVQAQNGGSFYFSNVHYWVVLIGCRRYLQLTRTIYRKPCPSRTKSSGSGVVKFVFESSKRAKFAIDGFR
jgi:hypothetical protein